jgi:hypothetical protein
VQLGTDGPVGNQLRLLNQQAACPGDTGLYNLRYIGHAPFTPGYGSDGEGGDGGDASGTTPLGDPVVFSAYLIGQIANNPRFAANFNLEADRGYGHLCWDWTRNRDDQAGLHDPRGHPYPAPLVLPPEGADDPSRYTNPHRWHPAPPTSAWQAPPPQHTPAMQLRYPGRECVEQPGPGEGPG